MNFLALCQRLRQEAGLSGTGPTTTVAQTGEMGRIVDWISAAYEDIQNAHASWRFLRTEFSFVTIASTQEYTPAAVSLTDHATWVKKDLRVYTTATPSDEQYLNYVPWDEYRITYMYGSNRTNEGRPTIISVKPDNSLTLWQIPDTALMTIDGEYYKTADVLSGNTSTPLIPDRFHMIIVWKGLMYYGAYAAAEEKFAHGQNEYKRLLRALELDQLEDFTYGEPLA